MAANMVRRPTTCSAKACITSDFAGPSRVLALATVAPPFRFSRMGPSGINRQLGDPNRKKIAQAMVAGGGPVSQIPAGFTYLGQFIDHDLTFDKTNVMLGENVSPAQLLQGAIAEPRPRLAVRRRSLGSRSRRSSTRPTAST